MLAFAFGLYLLLPPQSLTLGDDGIQYSCPPSWYLQPHDWLKNQLPASPQCSTGAAWPRMVFTFQTRHAIRLPALTWSKVLLLALYTVTNRTVFLFFFPTTSCEKAAEVPRTMLTFSVVCRVGVGENFGPFGETFWYYFLENPVLWCCPKKFIRFCHF